MKASELIKALESIVSEHGDCTVNIVLIGTSDEIASVEFDEEFKIIDLRDE